MIISHVLICLNKLSVIFNLYIVCNEINCSNCLICQIDGKLICPRCPHCQTINKPFFTSNDLKEIKIYFESYLELNKTFKVKHHQFIISQKIMSEITNIFEKDLSKNENNFISSNHETMLNLLNEMNVQYQLELENVISI